MIPIIDFSSAARNEPRDSKDYLKLVDEIRRAFTNIGFCYLTSHGISQEKVDQLFQLSREFFFQPLETKDKYFRPKGTDHGYVRLERQKVNPNSLEGDLHESFNYVPWHSEFTSSQVVEVPEYYAVNSSMFNSCGKLMFQILEVIGRGLNLDDPFFFVNAHNSLGTQGNKTRLRSIYYPPVKEVKQGQFRIGEHTDTGSITILFQDNQGGLEVMNREGHYIPATPIENTVLVNICDMMQRWTSDKLVSTYHRILMPDTEEKRKNFRQSIAFFGYPDNGYTITSIDGSNKYPPVKPEDYLLKHYHDIFPN